ncbi:MAG: ABC transporter permease [Actinomycetota bacterium]
MTTIDTTSTRPDELGAWTATRRLSITQLRLVLREPVVVAFVFAFPIVTVLVLGGVFDRNDPSFGGRPPSEYYAAAYVGVVISAIGLIMLPVQVASYREAGVLRRFHAAGFPSWSFPVSQFLIGLAYIVAGTVTVSIAAASSYGLPAVEDWPRTLLGFVVGSLAFMSIGVLLGSILPNARAAQGVGLMLFLPMFLLSGGGPPPDAMPDTMQTISDWSPLTHVMRAIQEPWLSFGDGTDHLVISAAIFVVATIAWIRARP